MKHGFLMKATACCTDETTYNLSHLYCCVCCQIMSLIFPLFLFPKTYSLHDDVDDKEEGNI